MKELLEKLAQEQGDSGNFAQSEPGLLAGELLRQREHIELLQKRLIKSEQLSSIGSLIAGVSHEINGPVSYTYHGAQNMEIRIQRLRDMIFGALEDDAEESIVQIFEEEFHSLATNLEAILDGCQRMMTMVQALRTFSRLEESHLEVCQLMTGLRSTAMLVKVNFREQVDFVLELDADPSLSASPAQLNQVFMNIMVNACHSMLEKRRRNSSFESGRLTVRSFLKEGQLAIQFVDTGEGIPEEVLHKIFEPFYSTKSDEVGNGLGLALSSEIVKQHGGEIEVETHLGAGTCMTVLLPLNSDAPDD